MEITRFLTVFLAAALSLYRAIHFADASDPEATSDYILPPSISQDNVTAAFFTFVPLKEAVVSGFVEHPVTVENLPALRGLGVSLATQSFPPNTYSGLEIHPRASELVHVISGTIHVGFVDSKNKAFRKLLQPGDTFVFPKGLPHYMFNADTKCETMCFSAFSSENPGVISLGTALFGSGIEEQVLEKAFNVSGNIIEDLKNANIC